MTYVLPLPLPEHLVRERGIVPANDFQQLHQAYGHGPDGRGFIATDLFYNFYRYDHADNRDVRAFIVTVLDPSFSIERQVVLEALTHEMTHVPGADGSEHFSFNDDISFGVTPRGELVFATQKNRTFVLAPASDGSLERIATHDATRGGAEGVSDVLALPDGRLLCLKSHSQMLFSAADASFRDGLPAFEPAGAIWGENSLGQSIGWYGGFRSYVGDLAALGPDRILVPFLASRMRSGNLDPDAFRFAIADGRGDLVASLPMGEADTPYRPAAAPHLRVLGHAPLGAWITRSEHAVRLFDRDGAALLRIGIGEDERFTNIRPLALFGVGPGGELLLLHRRHHTLVVTNPIRALDDLEPALAKASAVYRSEHNRLKKVAKGEGGRFLAFEPKTAPAALPKPKAKRKPKAAPAPERAPEPTPLDPEEAAAARPGNLEALAVYADWLGQKGDPLGEHVALHLRLAELDRSSAERVAVQARADELYARHRKEWLARWNTPHRLFDENLHLVHGLPASLKLDSVPQDLPGLDAQLSRLPIDALVLDGLGAKAIAKLGKLRSWRTVRHIYVSCDSKTKLGDSFARWLAAERLERLERLTLYRVELGGARAREILESMPALAELRLPRCALSADALVALSESSAAARIRALGLDDNPLSSAGFSSLTRWTALRELDLRSCDLGDELAELDMSFPVTTLRIRDNRRLGPVGLAWMARSFPHVTCLEVPAELTPEGVDALAPLAPILEDLDASQTSEATRARLVETLLPRAGKLRRLSLSLQSCARLLPAVLSASLEDLDMGFGRLGDRDVLALANAPAAAALRRLKLGGDFTDDGVLALARSPHLSGLESLELHSRMISERSAGAILEKLPSLRHLMLWEAEIRDSEPLRVDRDDVTLRLWKCKVPPRALDALRLRWGRRLSAG